MEMNTLPNYFAIIPANVRYCKELEMGARMLYGEITALANKHGYCWATNQYFADLYEVDVRTIRRWLTSLKENEFIFIEVERGGIQTTRQIFISKHHQEKFIGGQNCQKAGQLCLKVGDEIVPHNSTRKNTYEKQQQPAAAAAVFSCLKDIDIPQSEKEKISATFSETDIQHAITWTKGQVLKKPLAAALKWAAEHKPDLTIPKEEQTEKNRRYAKELLGEGKQNDRGYEATPLSKYVEIICTKANAPAVYIEYHIANFVQMLNNKLKEFCLC